MKTHYEIRGEGEPLLHGFTGTGADWQHIFKEPPAGFKLVIPDLRGHGRSANPSTTFTFRQSALDNFTLLDELKIERFSAIGLSGGALTLLRMATQQPARIEAMVLVSATHYFPAQDSIDDMNFTPPYLATIAARTLIVHGDGTHCILSTSRLKCTVPNGGHGPIFGERSNQFRDTALALVRDHP